MHSHAEPGFRLLFRRNWSTIEKTEGTGGTSLPVQHTKGLVETVDIFTSERNGRLTLHFVGELDHHAAKDVMRRADEILDRRLPRDCVLELSKLSFMDSSGVAVILRLHKRMRDMGGRIWVENPRAQPLRVLDISGIDRIVKICTTIKE